MMLCGELSLLGQPCVLPPDHEGGHAGQPITEQEHQRRMLAYLSRCAADGTEVIIGGEGQFAGIHINPRA